MAWWRKATPFGRVWASTGSAMSPLAITASNAASNQDRKTGDPNALLSELVKVTRQGLLGS